MNKSILEKRPHLIPCIIAAVMLFLALAPWPYGYYQLLRFVVCGISIYVSFMAYNWHKIWASWLFGFVAVLFNPLIPIYLSREIWQSIDVICGILFIAIAIILKEPITTSASHKVKSKKRRIQGKIIGNKTPFSIDDIVELRQNAQEADDPMALLAAFPSLHIKKGCILRAYPYRTKQGGVGNVWAIPESSNTTNPEEYETIDLFELARPFPIDNSCLDGLTMGGQVKLSRPPDALDNVMEAIEGDKTPWSYLSASIFARELAEFGASWHGAIWSTHTILGGDPWICPHVWFEEDKKGLLSEQGWQYLGRRPSEWKPSVVCNDGVTFVKFYTYSMLGQEAIYCFTDIYKPNNYKFECDVEIIAEGPNSMLF